MTVEPNPFTLEH